MKTRTLIFLLVPALVAPALAGPYSIARWTIDSGGGTSEGGRFRVSGTVGQPESGATSTGGRFAVTSGFWNGIRVIQVDGLPELKIVRAGRANVILTWTENGAADGRGVVRSEPGRLARHDAPDLLRRRRPSDPHSRSHGPVVLPA